MFGGDSFQFYNQSANENVDLNNLNIERLITVDDSPEKQPQQLQPSQQLQPQPQPQPQQQQPQPQLMPQAAGVIAPPMQPSLHPQFQQPGYQQAQFQQAIFQPAPFQPSQYQQRPTYSHPMYHQPSPCQQVSYQQPTYSRPMFSPHSFRPQTYPDPAIRQPMYQPQSLHSHRFHLPCQPPPPARSVYQPNYQHPFYPSLQPNYRSSFMPIPICDPSVSSTSHSQNLTYEQFNRLRGPSNFIGNDRNRMMMSAANPQAKKIRPNDFEN